VSGARGWLNQGRLDIGEVVDLEDLGLWVGAVLGEAARKIDAVAGPLGEVSIKLPHSGPLVDGNQDE
jgi:hypothetical protein